jgi:hypothetical protein
LPSTSPSAIALKRTVCAWSQSEPSKRSSMPSGVPSALRNSVVPSAWTNTRLSGGSAVTLTRVSGRGGRDNTTV